MNKILLITIVLMFTQSCSTHHSVNAKSNVKPVAVAKPYPTVSSRYIPTKTYPKIKPTYRTVPKGIPSTSSSTQKRVYTCSGLSKAEAYTYLKAGHAYLDRDRDGHPCEWGQRRTAYVPTRSSNCHYVSGYYRKSGTYVKGHTRCR